MMSHVAGEKVRTVYWGIITITDIRGGRYVAESGADYGPDEVEPVGEIDMMLSGASEPHPVLPALRFKVDVSRTYRNKSGYEAGGYKLNTSFVTEEHTPQSFIDAVIREGWPYTMVHAKRSPQETGAAARGVTTPKHTENFTSSQLLTADDDRQQPGVVDEWLSDPFFSVWGLMFVESVNSKPDAEKGHPTLLFDRPVTNPAIFKECMLALNFAYPQLDPLSNIDRTIYNAQGARVHVVGNVCPFEVFEREILEPYRTAQRERAAAIEAESERRMQEAAAARAKGVTASDDTQEAYLAGYLRWMLNKVASTAAGENRNKRIYWAGREIGGIESTGWARPYLHVLSDIEARIVDAASVNGYLRDHAGNDAREVLRVFALGRKRGGAPLDEPAPRIAIRAGAGVAPSPPLNGNGEDHGEMSTPAQSVEPIHCTDLGNARRLVRQFGHRMRYVAEHGFWYIWNGRIWKRDTSGEARRFAKQTVSSIYAECANVVDDAERKALVKHGLRSEALGRLEAMLSVAESEEAIALTAEQMDAHPWLLVVRNGTVDLRTGELGPHDSGQLITRVVDVDYEPSAGCPIWLEFLDTIFDHDATLISFIQRAAGYSLTGDTSEQCLFYAHGKGRNGKSTLIDILAAATGDYFQKLNTEALLAKNYGNIPNDIAMLPGARLVTAAEVEGGRRLAESLVKDLTGGDAIQARFMRAEWFTFKPQFKLWLYGNHKVHIRGTDDGIWRRIRLIPFNVQIPENLVDRHLAEKLRAELPGILPWMVQGCLEWQRHGLGEPAAVTSATRTYREEEDFLGEFLSEACERHGASSEKAAELFNAYREWCRQSGERELPQRTFGMLLRERGFDRERQSAGNYWTGLELTEHGRELRDKWLLRGEK